MPAPTPRARAMTLAPFCRAAAQHLRTLRGLKRDVARKREREARGPSRASADFFANCGCRERVCVCVCMSRGRKPRAVRPKQRRQTPASDQTPRPPCPCPLSPSSPGSLLPLALPFPAAGSPPPLSGGGLGVPREGRGLENGRRTVARVRLKTPTTGASRRWPRQPGRSLFRPLQTPSRGEDGGGRAEEAGEGWAMRNMAATRGGGCRRSMIPPPKGIRGRGGEAAFVCPASASTPCVSSGSGADLQAAGSWSAGKPLCLSSPEPP